MVGARKAIIIGSGPAGLATALRLQQKTNILCTVYELRAEPTTLGGAVGIPSNGLRLLQRLGVYDGIMSRGSSHSNLRIHSIQGGIVGEQALLSKAEEETGFGYVRVKRTDLVDVLLNATKEAKIPVIYNKRITIIDDTEAKLQVAFSDGTIDTADLLIGCDGVHSTVRRLYVDPLQTPEYSGTAGLCTIMPSSELPDSVASQLRGMNITMTQEGMFLTMTCTANDDEIFWAFSRRMPVPELEDTRDGWEVRRQQEVEGFKSSMRSILSAAKGEWGNSMRMIVDKTSAIQFHPVYKLPLGGTWFKGRVVLLGDAAHAMPPHAGQGVSMALEDSFLLARLLADSGASLGDVYQTYEHIRRPRVNEIANRSVRNGEARGKTGPWGLWFKELGIWLYLKGYWTLGLDRWGSQHNQVVYDIEEEPLVCKMHTETVG